MKSRPAPSYNPRPLIAAGTFLGVGMGGFADGIAFHQILQLHNMVSARYPPTTLVNAEINMTWDGIFHAFTWLMTAIGIALLWRAGRKPEVPWSGQILVGSLLQGWGLFNLVEGVIDHHLLHLHHVVERLGPSIADWMFLLSGVLLLGIGRGLIGRGRRETGGTDPAPKIASG